MRDYHIVLKETVKDIYPANIRLGGFNPAGEKISFSNYYMEKNGLPFFGISGEFHFSRFDHHYWEDELIKVKMGGINIVSTYIFWNHHEEEEGIFEWDGNKNLKKFVELCAKHDLNVIIRIGPFNHGEVRNGGIPDWMFGQPFEIRSNDDAYLYYVKRLYNQIWIQVRGLLHKDGGPIIGTQLENEFQHAGAPWELTTGTSNEWLSAGENGDSHIKKLKEIAIESGIETPIYTGTGWGGAAAPMDEVLPLWGGYAYWPWIFYGEANEHPATPNYIFRDYHNNNIPRTFDFEPTYKPESLPFACAEMGGGMTVFYNYRFKLPYESVDALSSIKVAGGCNFLGYYVYHGGSNPKGKKTPFLNETATPKISYDYQAPIGEFGQIRKSYHRLKRQHLFYQQYQESFAKTKTVLAQDPDTVSPNDVDTLRYAARVDGRSGFIYINNFQDHVETKDQHDFSVSLNFGDQTIRLPEKGSLYLSKDDNCILPFNFDLSGVNLNYSTTQLITELIHNGEKHYFFYIPKRMKAEYVFDSNNVSHIDVDNGIVVTERGKVIVQVENMISKISITTKDNVKVHVCTVTDEDSLKLWKVNLKGQERILITDANVLISENEWRVEYYENQLSFMSFPAFDNSIQVLGQKCVGTQNGMFTEYVLQTNSKHIDLHINYVKENKATIALNAESFKGVKEIMLKIDYVGDIGYAFIDGDLINDNFCNNDTWEIGLMRFKQILLDKGMYIYISPLKEGVSIKSDSPMAARTETVGKFSAEIKSIKATPVFKAEVLY